MLVFVSMCPGDLASTSVLAAIARPPYYYVINAFHSFILLQTVQEKMCSHIYSILFSLLFTDYRAVCKLCICKIFLNVYISEIKKKSLNLIFGSKNN